MFKQYRAHHTVHDSMNQFVENLEKELHIQMTVFENLRVYVHSSTCGSKECLHLSI